MTEEIPPKDIPAKKLFPPFQVDESKLSAVRINPEDDDQDVENTWGPPDAIRMIHIPTFDEFWKLLRRRYCPEGARMFCEVRWKNPDEYYLTDVVYSAQSPFTHTTFLITVPCAVCQFNVTNSPLRGSQFGYPKYWEIIVAPAGVTAVAIEEYPFQIFDKMDEWPRFFAE